MSRKITQIKKSSPTAAKLMGFSNPDSRGGTGGRGTAVVVAGKRPEPSGSGVVPVGTKRSAPIAKLIGRAIHPASPEGKVVLKALKREKFNARILPRDAQRVEKIESPLIIKAFSASTPRSVAVTEQSLERAISKGTLASTLFEGKVIECDTGRNPELAVCHIAIPRKNGTTGTLTFVGSAIKFEKQQVLFRLDRQGQIASAIPAKDAVMFTGLVSKDIVGSDTGYGFSVAARKATEKAI
ncbi:MAG: hypothetical protein JNJ55_14290 [Betaproteobacteria bacterium]|nr:hypothetical protein [Betaproteobacteria bacterium]